jgi:hypothetical protein
MNEETVRERIMRVRRCAVCFTYCGHRPMRVRRFMVCLTCAATNDGRSLHGLAGAAGCQREAMYTRVLPRRGDGSGRGGLPSLPASAAWYTSIWAPHLTHDGTRYARGVADCSASRGFRFRVQDSAMTRGDARSRMCRHSGEARLFLVK